MASLPDTRGASPGIAAEETTANQRRPRSRARAAGCALVLAMALLAFPARASEVALGVGADVWTEGNTSALFNFTVDFLLTVVPNLEIGLRPGVFIVTPGSLGTTTGGIPLDFQLRGVVGHFYIEGLAGPWFFFSGTVVRAHVGAGLGYRGGPFRIGIEGAYLTDGADVGLRFAFAF